MAELEGLHGTEVLRSGQADVSAYREQSRLRRIRRLSILVSGIAACMALRAIWGVSLLPTVSVSPQVAPSIFIVVMLGCVLLIPMIAAGRSPHVLYRPTDIDVG